MNIDLKAIVMKNVQITITKSETKLLIIKGETSGFKFVYNLKSFR